MAKTASKIQILIRSVREISENSRFSTLKDPDGLLAFSEGKAKTYRENPFLNGVDGPCQLLGVQDGIVISRRNSMPSRIVADGVSYDTRTSGAVYVNPQCRSSLLAISMIGQALKFPNGDLNINCWLSQQNCKFYRLLGAAMFRINVFEAGGRWNRYYKPSSYRSLKWVAAKLLNEIVSLLNFIFDRGRWGGLPNWRICSYESKDEAFLRRASELVETDEHRYRQAITPEWIRWTLENDFKSDSKEKFALGVYDSDIFVGFALIRLDHGARFAKIYEWQVDPAYRDREAEFLSVVAKRICRYGWRVHIVVDASIDDLNERLRGRFPEVNFNHAVVTIADESKFNSFEGIRDVANWRVRPGMGDAPFW